MNIPLASLGPVFLLLIFGVLIVAAAFVAQLTKQKSTNTPNAKTAGLYAARSTILTPAERSFAGVLDGALPDGTAWFAKVRVGDIVTTAKGLPPSTRTAARNRINQKHVDFLLVRATDFAPLAGIELDDRSHEEEERKTRDKFVDDVFAACSLPLLHVPAQAAYKQAELRATISAALSKPA
ncbi:MAG TPA: DUF2726 domain-containing protein [Opitutaceae bacterium]|nr:DUF2726 domain-containing protein [Opitutaceae bacterium]